MQFKSSAPARLSRKTGSSSVTHPNRVGRRRSCRSRRRHPAVGARRRRASAASAHHWASNCTAGVLHGEIAPDRGLDRPADGQDAVVLQDHRLPRRASRRSWHPRWYQHRPRTPRTPRGLESRQSCVSGSSGRRVRTTPCRREWEWAAASAIGARLVQFSGWRAAGSAAPWRAPAAPRSRRHG
jgi:hypothetical protein